MALFGNTFVTGGTGLLGPELLQQLLQNNETSKLVCLVKDFNPQSRFFTEGIDKKVVIVPGDIRDDVLLAKTLKDHEINTVFHLAAQALVVPANLSPPETLDVNIRGTWLLLEAIRQSSSVKSTIVASSDKAYGNLKGNMYNEDFPLAGTHPYDVSKSCADLISSMYAHSYGMNICVTRCGNFFGPGDLTDSRIFPATIMSILKGEGPVLRSDGNYIRDYLYVADAAAAYRLLAQKMAASKDLAGEAFNFSYGLRLKVIEVVDKILHAMNSNLKPTILNIAKNEIPEQCLDSSKAAKMLNWKPQFGFEEGLVKTIQWYSESM